VEIFEPHAFRRQRQVLFTPLGDDLVDQMLAPAIEIERAQFLQRRERSVVVEELAPRCRIASGRIWKRCASNWSGGTKSRNVRLRRFCQRRSWPSQSHKTRSSRPCSFNAATMFEPMKPAAPVTTIIPSPLCDETPGLPMTQRSRRVY